MALSIDAIKTAEPFESLFPIDAHTLNAIHADMEKRGYDDSQPIVLWKGKNIVVDGHTRLLAAQGTDLKHVPVHHMEFKDEYEAIQYAIHSQRDRRNITDSDLHRCIQAVDKLKPKGGDHGNQHTGGKEAKGAVAPIGRSAEQTAGIVGTSPDKVKKSRAVEKHGTPEVKQALTEGTITINKAYTETQKTRKKQKADRPATEDAASADKKAKKPTLGPPCDGMQFARMAIMDLEQIRDDDVERNQAFTTVMRWLDAKQTTAPAHEAV
jgi:ParB-like chromosome segregation protein Spo0J